ncbi:hypothetical protein EJ02DRAFT_150253 [Clathrospora elynae]|uniref:Fe2OG dioxygenase domain-containing protein n=1 Tax=Clathrospora elynae TaxID=706981 RepID=A0A6A5S588_9PLEO|nr:hypothetical protein EJ02DRAFT_150253 [Clathrospora elynae]
MWSMLAVSISSGQGTDFHYDEGDDGHFYSAIVVLETSGYLDLLELDEALEVKPGDMVLFLANQQLHKLSRCVGCILLCLPLHSRPLHHSRLRNGPDGDVWVSVVGRACAGRLSN